MLAHEAAVMLRYAQSGANVHAVTCTTIYICTVMRWMETLPSLRFTLHQLACVLQLEVTCMSSANPKCALSSGSSRAGCSFISSFTCSPQFDICAIWDVNWCGWFLKVQMGDCWSTSVWRDMQRWCDCVAQGSWLLECVYWSLSNPFIGTRQRLLPKHNMYQ